MQLHFEAFKLPQTQKTSYFPTPNQLKPNINTPKANPTYTHQRNIPKHQKFNQKN
jgi:hypothetical protein